MLCAFLASQLKNLSRAHIHEALEGAAEDSSVSLLTRLTGAGVLSPEEADLIRRMADAAVEANQGDAGAALNAFGGEAALREALDPAHTTPDSSGRATTLMQNGTFQFPDAPLIDPIHEIPGRYTVTSEHGRGGMGRILLAHDIKMGRDIALKELLPTTETSMILPEQSPRRYTAAMAARFLQEGRITAGLEHPSIVPVYEIGRRESGNLYYTMKLVRGRSLSHTLSACANLEERLALLPHFVDLCEAIAYAHSRGVLHRDIKPSNVMIGEFGETVVLDWGLAKIKAQAEDPLEQQIRETPRFFADKTMPLPETRAGQAIGTPEYMPPEQVQGAAEKIDERSDVYSLGVVLYEFLTGTTPFRSDSVSETMRRVVVEVAQPAREKETDAPAELVSICEKALRKAPEERYQSVRELADEVKRFQTGALVQTYRYSLGELARRYYKRHRAVLNVAAAAAAVVLGLAVFSYGQIYQARNREHDQRLLAENARDAAIIAEDKAEKAREEAEHTAYVAQIRLLDAYVRNRNFARANRLVWEIAEPHRNWEWGYLLEQCNQDHFTLRGHHGILFRAIMDRRGKRILTLAGDRTARIWDADSGSPIVEIKTPYALINDGQFSPDESSVALALWDGTARLFDAFSGEEIMTFKGHTASVRSVRFFLDTDWLLTASNDGTLRIWSTTTGTQIDCLEDPGSEIMGAYPSPGRTRFVSATSTGMLRLWDLSLSDEPLRSMPGTLPVYSASGILICFVDNGAAVVWDSGADSELLRIEPGTAQVLRVRFSPDDRRLVTAATDGIARVYDVETGALLNSFNHGEEIADAVFSPNQRLILLRSDAGLITVWDADSGARIASFTGHEAGIAAAVFSPDSQHVITASRDHTARVWDVYRPLTHRAVVEQSSPAVRVAVSGDGERCAVATQSCVLSVCDGRTLQPMPAHWCFSHFGAASVALSSDGALLAAPLDGFTVFVLDTSTGKALSTYTGHRGRVYATAFSPDSSSVLTASRDGTAQIWDAGNAQTHTVLKGHSKPLRCAAFSPDGSVVATGGDDATIHLWNAQTGAEIQTLNKHTGSVNAVAFDATGKRLLSASNDGTVLCWDLARREAQVQFLGHSDQVASAQFSPNGERILTASWDKTCRVWDAATGDELLSFGTGEHPFLDAAFVRGSRNVLTASWDGCVTAHFAGPWHREQLEGNPGDSFQARYEAARPSRLEERWPDPDQAAPGAKAFVHTTYRRYYERFTLLYDLIPDEDAAASAHDMVITPGAVADAAKRLCLLPGDQITRINDTRITDRASFIDALSTFILDMDEPPRDKLEIVRGGTPVELNYIFYPQIEIEQPVTLSREAVGECINYLEDVLILGIEQLLRVNQDMNTRLGEPVSERDSLNGLWIPPETGDQGPAILEMLGIAVGDRILSLNGTRIESLSQLEEFIRAVKSKLATNDPIRVDATIERGEFQVVKLTIEVT
jgi:WD40 repeat protein/serine/threonine protein kinase